MLKFEQWDRLIAVGGLLLAVSARAEAYIDPGSASVIYTVGLAPVLAFLAWLGRRVVRALARRGKEKTEEGSDEQTEAR